MCLLSVTHTQATRTHRFNYAVINEVLCVRWRRRDLFVVTMSEGEAEEHWGLMTEEREERGESWSEGGIKAHWEPRASRTK